MTTARIQTAGVLRASPFLAYRAVARGAGIDPATSAHLNDETALCQLSYPRRTILLQQGILPE
jgi:hypothetical protein